MLSSLVPLVLIGASRAVAVAVSLIQVHTPVVSASALPAWPLDGTCMSTLPLFKSSLLTMSGCRCCRYVDEAGGVDCFA